MILFGRFSELPFILPPLPSLRRKGLLLYGQFGRFISKVTSGVQRKNLWEICVRGGGFNGGGTLHVFRLSLFFGSIALFIEHLTFFARF